MNAHRRRTALCRESSSGCLPPGQVSWLTGAARACTLSRLRRLPGQPRACAFVLRKHEFSQWLVSQPMPDHSGATAADSHGTSLEPGGARRPSTQLPPGTQSSCRRVSETPGASRPGLSQWKVRPECEAEADFGANQPVLPADGDARCAQPCLSHERPHRALDGRTPVDNPRPRYGGRAARRPLGASARMAPRSCRHVWNAYTGVDSTETVM